ncbi:MAG: putative DNA base hypermodification protein, partial [Armatimonadota bacterium]|nr:putative DNA base hypermodification protein [Armatimonadota bacterium]
MSDLPYDPAWERRFWAFVAERQRVWHRRHVENRPPPWTDDPILRSYRFANVYRELDRGTRYLHDVLVPAFGAAAPPDKLWVSLVYRVVNRRETFERLGWLPRPEGAEIDRWVSDLRDLRGGGEAVFTNRH